MMKKIYIYTSLLLLTVAGCKKELIQNPTYAIASRDAFANPADFTNAILGAYDGLRGSYYYGGEDAGSMATTPDVLSDNLILSSFGRKSESTFYNFAMTGTDEWDLWPNAYTNILRDNYIIANINNLPDGDFKNDIEGEALALRALAHFDLLRVYAKSYTSATDADPGVPYVTSTDATLKPSRTPDKQAYALVVADMVKAISLIGKYNGPYRLGKSAAEGILSRIYLYEGDWANAITSATASITDANSRGHVLATPATFGSIWVDADDTTSTEVLFRVSFQDADGIDIGVGYEQGSGTSVKPEYSPDSSLVTLYKSPNIDVRKTAYVDTTTFNKAHLYYVKKYFGRASGDANVVDFKVIRLGEVYLNRAEAEYNTGDFAGALADLNTLRAARYVTFTAGTETGTDLYNAILLQRRLELAFEGHRFFDLKRLNLPIQRSGFGDYADGTGTPAAVQLIPAGSNKFEIPIPQSEIDANSNIKQNPQ
jgi:hypothetical protein